MYIHLILVKSSKEQGNWDSFADGLIGSSYGFNYGNPTVTPTWFDSYIKLNTSIPNSYSVCFGREKGILSVGGIDMSLTVLCSQLV